MPTDLKNDYDYFTGAPCGGGQGYMRWSDYRSRNWTNTPGYPLNDRRNLPENSYSDFQNVWKATGMGKTKTYQGVTGCQNVVYAVQHEGDPWYSHHYYPDALWFTNLRALLRTESDLLNEAKTKALLRAGDMKVNLAVSLLEAEKTSSMILDTARRIDRAYRALRRGNFREVARQLNLPPSRVHKTWLEYKYGWTPLLMEVKGSAELLAQHHLRRAESFEASATVSDSKVWNYQSVTAAPGGTSVWRASSAQRIARVKLRCRIDNPIAAAAQQMGLTNPALVAWEVVPYSFVFDWFISVGDWLTAITSLQGLTVISAMSSTVFSGVGTHTQTENGKDFWGVWLNPATCDASAKRREYSRNPLSLSGLTVYPVVHSDAFGFQKLVTSLALMRSSSSRFARI